MARWAEELASFDLIIKYVQKNNNAKADALSKLLGYEGDKIYNKIALLKKLDNGDLIPHIQKTAAIELKKP